MEPQHYRKPKRNEGTNDLPMFDAAPVEGGCSACGGTRAVPVFLEPAHRPAFHILCERCRLTQGLEPLPGSTTLTPPEKPEAA